MQFELLPRAEAQIVHQGLVLAIDRHRVVPGQDSEIDGPVVPATSDRCLSFYRLRGRLAVVDEGVHRPDRVVIGVRHLDKTLDPHCGENISAERVLMHLQKDFAQGTFTLGIDRGRHNHRRDAEWRGTVDDPGLGRIRRVRRRHIIVDDGVDCG
ncbi:MAG: hypothetical protein ACD_75C02153G0001, partial [uncultured bacterium]